MSDLGYFKVSATYLGSWIDLNDGIDYRLASDPSLANVTKPRRKIVATSPVLDGEYLLHATTGMMVESMKWWIYGEDQADLASNLLQLESIFDQFDYRVRVNFDNYQETWTCQLADVTIERSQVYAHSLMAGLTAQIPRFPTPVREEVL